MQKHIFILRELGNEDYLSFKNRVFNIVNPFVNIDSIKELKFTITDQKPPTLSVIPFRKDKIAVVSLKTDSTYAIDGLKKVDGIQAAYQVEEALPIAYEMSWPDGQETPGICLLTLFKKKEGLDYDKFIDRWHNGHTPLSLKIHPLWNYNRNVVKKELTGSSFWYDGIVEEHFRNSSDLLNPLKFFGNPGVVIPRMLKVYTDVKSFINYSSIESYLANEFILKSIKP